MAEKSKILDLKGNPFDIVDNSVIRRVGEETNTFSDSISISQVLGGVGGVGVRTRQELYKIYHQMSINPIISTGLNLHVTQSIGGHETTGDVVFIEKKPNITPAEEKYVDELQARITPIINDAAYQLCFSGIAFGDAYARIYTDKKKGVIAIDVSDLYLPQLVQSYERGGKTVGYEISVEKGGDKTVFLTAMQMARLKIPRMYFTPQTRMQYNHYVASVEQDDFTKIQPIPATVGGSFLEPAENSFFLLQTALAGLNSSRILDAIRESILGLNVNNMTKDQRDIFIDRVATMLRSGKEKAAKAILDGNPIVENTYHLLPMFNEKQLYSVDAGGSKNSSSANSYNVEDVMFYAKMLAGSLGLDLSMLGFAELLSGGLGDGGFFRVSAQSAQKARLIRQGFTAMINDIIDVHTYSRYGGIFEGGARPYNINFVGATSALEREEQDTRERKVNGSAILLQVIQQLKENGADEKTAAHFLKEQCGLDEDDANLFAKMVAAASGNNENEKDF